MGRKSKARKHNRENRRKHKIESKNDFLQLFDYQQELVKDLVFSSQKGYLLPNSTEGLLVFLVLSNRH